MDPKDFDERTVKVAAGVRTAAGALVIGLLLALTQVPDPGPGLPGVPASSNGSYDVPAETPSIGTPSADATIEPLPPTF